MCLWSTKQPNTTKNGMLECVSKELSPFLTRLHVMRCFVLRVQHL